MNNEKYCGMPETACSSTMQGGRDYWDTWTTQAMQGTAHNVSKNLTILQSSYSRYTVH